MLRAASVVSLFSGTGEPVARIYGAHGLREASGMAVLPGQRCWHFPVMGTARADAVMTAVNESGVTVLWFRILDQPGLCTR
jgi:hypothetical protein